MRKGLSELLIAIGCAREGADGSPANAEGSGPTGQCEWVRGLARSLGEIRPRTRDEWKRGDHEPRGLRGSSAGMESGFGQAIAARGDVWSLGVAEVSTECRSRRGGPVLHAQIDAGDRLQPSIPAIGGPARINRTDYFFVIRTNYKRQKTLPRMNGAGHRRSGWSYKGRISSWSIWPLREQNTMDR